MKAEICPRCDNEERLRHREFSTQAIAALVVWGEIAEKAVGEPICGGCYDELREVLIERNEEINNPKPDRRTVVVPAKQAVNARAAVEEAKKPSAKETKVKESKSSAAKAPIKAAKDTKASKEKAAKGKKPAPAAKKTVSAKSKNVKTVAAAKGKKVKKAS